MIAEFEAYCISKATSSLQKALLAYLRNESQLPMEAIKSTRPEEESSYQRVCTLGYLAALHGEFVEEFTNAVGVLSGRKFSPRDSIVDDNLALLGCYIGLSELGLLGNCQWFHSLLEIKQSLGGTHADFCDAVSGKCPARGHSHMELYLFLRQRNSVVPIVDTTLREWMLAHWCKPFPFYNDFLRDLIAQTVLNAGMEMILRHLEERSAKLPLTKANLLLIDEAEQQIGKSHLGEAIDTLGSVLDQYDSIPVHTDLLHLRSRWNGLRRKRIRESISDKDANIEEGQVRDGLVDLIQELRGFI